jgi:hypothetical protein
MKLKNERDPFCSRYTVIADDGRVLGTVHSEHSSKARHVKGSGGVTRWVATTPEGMVVSESNTYRRIDALEALQDADV